MTNQQTLFPGVNYTLGEIRRLPLSGSYVTQLMDVVRRTDPTLTIDITSAAQAPAGSGGTRTGGDRHDIDHTGHGHTSDFVLVRDGKRILPDDDQELYARLFQNAAASGFTGMGHYSWGVHIGGGSQAFWGPSTGRSSANPVFLAAAEAGWAGNWSDGSNSNTTARPAAPQSTTGTPSNPSGTAFTFASVVEAGNGFTTVQGSDGLNYKLSGPRNWRNNNPGNIEFGSFAQSHGAVGSDGRFAVFPSYEAGRAAKEALIFQGSGYQGMSIAQAIGRYAPESDGNNTQLYVRTVAGSVGIDPETPLSQLNADQRRAMMDAMESFEGYQAGQITRNGQRVNIDLKSAFNPRNGPSAPSFAGDSQFSMAAGNHTVDIGQLSPASPLSQSELREQDRQRAERDRAGVLDLLSTALSQETVLGWALRDRPQFMPDAACVFDAGAATKDIPEAYWHRFNHTASGAQTEFIRQGIINDMEADEKLADAGLLGVALRIGAGITDPVAWAAGAGIAIGTGGTGLPAFLGAKFGRAGMIAYGAGIGAAATAAPEAYIASQKPTYEAADFYMSVGAGLVLGGAFGAFARTAEGAQIEALGKDILRNGPEGVPVTGRNSSAGAAQASVREDLRVDTAEMIRDLDDTVAPRSWGKTRFDLAHSLKSSDNNLVRALGNVLVEDGTRNRTGLTPFSASESTTKLSRQADIQWRRAFDTNFKEYMKRNGTKWGDKEAARTVFAKEITAAVRSRNPLDSFSPEVAAAGAEFRNLMKHWRTLAANPGILDGTTRRAVRGFDKVKDNDFYVPRIFDLGAIQDALGKYGHDTLSAMVGRAMREVNEDLSEELSNKFGKAYIRKLHSLSVGELNLNSRALSGDDMEGLRQILRDGTDLSDIEMDDLLLGIKPKRSNGESPRAKKRLFFDEDFSAKLSRMDSSGADDFRVSNLFMNDADDLMTMYSRQMAGRVSMARVRIENPKWREGDEGSRYLIDGVTSDGEWDTLIQQVRSVGDSMGVKTSEADLKRLKFTYDTITGRPYFSESNNYAQTLRMLRDYNFMRVMNQVGFAQMAEFGNIMWQTGLRATFTNMPSWRAMWRNAKTGKLDDTLAQEWEDITGLGADWLRHSDLRRLDDFENPLAGIRGNQTIDKIDRLQQKGVRAVTALSAMAPINTALSVSRAARSSISSLNWLGRAGTSRLTGGCRASASTVPCSSA